MTNDERRLRHRNDLYGETPELATGSSPAVPAATVVLLRDADTLEVLMLHKASQVAFGGMWVFPGGRIDAGDYPDDGDVDTAARNAAVRETLEEAGIVAEPGDFVWFAHWTPPPGTPKRFATWFFAARANAHEVTIDGGEIQNHAWLSPLRALEQHAAGAIDLAPPTWVTLHQLARHATVDVALERLGGRPPRVYQTRIATRADGVRVALWEGDAGYPEGDAGAEGGRHRLVMKPGGFEFENAFDGD
jgi:8-oxo-dGTP pyrophosphatase MutT (NUDIX family)